MSKQPEPAEPADPRKLRDLLLQTVRLTLQGADLLAEPPPATNHQPPATNHPPSTAITWSRINRYLAPVRWDWPGWLPRGFLTVLASEPGTGKSLLCLHLAATYLNRTPWPDGTPFSGPAGHVIWCESESSHALNLQRARAWDLDLERILSPLKSPLRNFKIDDRDHVQALLVLAGRPEVRLVVLDSLRGLRRPGRHGGAIEHLLEAIADLARITGKPFLLTHHLRKQAGQSRSGAVTLDHLLGASAISQVARLVWAVDTPDPLQPAHRRLSVIKNNLARVPAPLGFHIHDHGLDFGPPPQPLAVATQFDRALVLLRRQLAAGPQPFSQIQAAYHAAGLSERTIRRAKKHLAIRSTRPPGTTEWHWSLPVEDGQP